MNEDRNNFELSIPLTPALSPEGAREKTFETNDSKPADNTAVASPRRTTAFGDAAPDPEPGAVARSSSLESYLDLAAEEIEPEANSGVCARELPVCPDANFIEHSPLSPCGGATIDPLGTLLPASAPNASAAAGDDNAAAEVSSFPVAPSPARTGQLTSISLSRQIRSTATEADIREANDRKTICEQFLALTRDGSHSLTTAARACGKSPSWFSGPDSMLARYQRDGLAGVLAQQTTATKVGDLTAQIESLTWFIPAGQFFYLLTNRTNISGSVPEAIRRVISLPGIPNGWTNTILQRFLKKIGLNLLPTCPEDLREIILARAKAGQPMVPDRIVKAITRAVTQQVIEQYRRPHETGLNYLQSPGTMMIQRRDGIQNFVRAGDILEADDGSINFPVCIPWTSPNGGLITETPCSANYGVIVGRFQWLRTIDVATRFRPGWVFVARSRGGYRGADVLTLMHGITRQHGAWEEYRFERGVFKSNLVKRAVELLGSRLHTVISPHSKPFIEGGFNQDWTKLSVHFPQCDIGRYRGDTEEANKLVQSCRTGAKDPRKYFPMLADALKAFAAITEEENRTLVKSRNSGQWVPEEKWQREVQHNPLRKIESAMAFMFAPYAIEWKVKGMLVGGRVPIFEDMSVPFDFSAPWLQEFCGAKLRLHFDPTEPKCFATPVLLQDWNGHRTGEVLPPLTQVNETTGYIRTILGWGDDIGTAGLKAKQQAAVAMRREVRTVMPGGKSGYTRSEVKALDATGIVERGLSQSAADGQHDDKRTSRDFVPGAALRVETTRGPQDADRATRRAELEKFERENQHLFA